MKRTFAFRLLLACSLAVFWVWPPLAPSSVVVAFTKTWQLTGCNVPGLDVGLWDDAPGAGLYNESAFFWFETPGSGDERCTYRSLVVGDPSSTSLRLSVRAAVNDGASLIVTVHTGADDEFGSACSGETLGTVVISGNPLGLGFFVPHLSRESSQNAFVTEWVSLVSGKAIHDVCMTLDDAPSNVLSQRASALVDYIKLSESIQPPLVCQTPPCLGFVDAPTVWAETFDRAQ